MRSGRGMQSVTCGSGHRCISQGLVRNLISPVCIVYENFPMHDGWLKFTTSIQRKPVFSWKYLEILSKPSCSCKVRPFTKITAKNIRLRSEPTEYLFITPQPFLSRHKRKRQYIVDHPVAAPCTSPPSSPTSSASRMSLIDTLLSLPPRPHV